MGSLSILFITKAYSWMIELFFIEKNSPGWTTWLQTILLKQPFGSRPTFNTLMGARVCSTPTTSTWRSWTDRVNSLSGYCSWHQIKQAGNLPSEPI